MSNTFVFDCSGSSMSGPISFCGNGNCTFYFEITLTGTLDNTNGFLPPGEIAPSILPLLQKSSKN